MTRRRIEPVSPKQSIDLRSAERPRRRPWSGTKSGPKPGLRRTPIMLLAKSTPHVELRPLDGENALTQGLEGLSARIRRGRRSSH